jgi:hypothetical protein
VTQLGGEDAVAGVDGILHITNEMGEADLIFLFRPPTVGRRPRQGGNRRGKSRPCFMLRSACEDEST